LPKFVEFTMNYDVIDINLAKIFNVIKFHYKLFCCDLD